MFLGSSIYPLYNIVALNPEESTSVFKLVLELALEVMLVNRQGCDIDLVGKLIDVLGPMLPKLPKFGAENWEKY